MLNQFVCKKCKTMEMDENSDVEKMNAVVQMFCYLDDSIGSLGGAGANVIARVKNELSKFRKLSCHY